MTLLRTTNSPLLLIAALTLFTSTSLAQTDGSECAKDSDCEAGSTCAKDQWTSGCAASPDGSTSDCDTTIHESEFGVCVTPPQACTSDAECGEYLGCVTQNMGSCSGGPDGEFVCEEVESESYCGVKEQACETDSDCPREFECVELQMPCLTIACPEDAPDCGGCSGEKVSECRPKEIGCESDDQCPSDWSCLGTVSYECSGGGEDSATGSGETPGSDGDSGGGAAEGGASAGGATSTDPAHLAPDPTDVDGDAPEPPPEDPGGAGEEGEPRVDIPEETCVEIPAQGSCYPNEWGVGGELDLGASSSGDVTDVGGDGTAEEAPPKSPGTAESDDGSSSDASGTEGGCSVSPVKPLNSGWLLSLIFVLPTLRRRFAQSSLKS